MFVSSPHLYEASLLHLQRVEVLSQAALPSAKSFIVHSQLPRMGWQFGHLLSQTDEQSPILAFHRLQVRVVVGQRVEQRGLNALQTQKVTVIVGTVGVDEDVDARAITPLNGDQGVRLILIGRDVG